MKILLDTNVWLAVLTRRGVCRRFWRRLRIGNEVYSGEWILEEIEEKLPLRFSATPRNAARLARFARRSTHVVQPQKPILAVCRDPDDDEVLALALTAACEWVVTGDKDLLVLDGYEGIRIVTVRQFSVAMGWSV